MNKRLLFLMCLLSISLNVFSGEIDVGKLHKAKWLRLTSENFLVITDAKEKQAQAMARELEQFRYFVALLLGYKQYDLPQKIPVILAKDKSTFTSMGLPAEYAGFFVKRGQPLIFANSKGFTSSGDARSSEGRQVVLHELTHLLINNASLGLANPPWYCEGVAEYFGTYVEKKGQVLLGDMSLLKNRFYTLQKPGDMGFESIDTESLFKTEEFEAVVDTSRREQKEVEKFYARSFAVVHYLNADPQRRTKLYKYLLLINKGYSVDETFKAVFQMTFAELDEQLDQYISGKYVFARVFDIGKGGIEYPEFHFTTQQLEQREAMNLLVPEIGELAGASFMPQENIDAMYQDITKLYPDFGRRDETP